MGLKYIQIFLTYKEEKRDLIHFHQNVRIIPYRLIEWENSRSRNHSYIYSGKANSNLMITKLKLAK